MAVMRDPRARRQQLCDDAVEFTKDYLRVNGQHAPLRLYAAKYGKAFVHAGMTLRQALAEDGRFRLILTNKKTGAYVVEVQNPIEEKILRILRSGPLHHQEIKKHFVGTDVLQVDYSGTMMRMFERELIDTKDGIVFLFGQSPDAPHRHIEEISAPQSESGAVYETSND